MALRFQVLEAVNSLATGALSGHVLVFGLDANVHEPPCKGSKAKDYREWEAAVKSLGLATNWGTPIDPSKARTTYNARTYLQPQLQKAVKYSEFTKVGLLRSSSF